MKIETIKISDEILESVYGPNFKEEMEKEKELWCSCPEQDGSIDYYQDGEHPELDKHHYRHRKCGKIVQIG